MLIENMWMHVGLSLALQKQTCGRIFTKYNHSHLSSRTGWATASFRQAMLASATLLSEARESLVSARSVMKRWPRPSS